MRRKYEYSSKSSADGIGGENGRHDGAQEGTIV